MKKIIVLLLAAGFFLSSCSAAKNPDEAVLSSTDWGWKIVGGSQIEYGWASVNVFESVQSISLVRFPLGAYTVSVVNAEGADAAVTSTLGERNGALAAINGSFFNMQTLYSEAFLKDEGLVTCSSTKDSPYRSNGLLLMDGANVDITLADSLSYSSVTSARHEAIATGPVLIDEGAIVNYAPSSEEGGSIDPKYYKKFFDHRHPRTLLGYTSDGWVYFVVVDGRFPSEGEGMTVSELQTLSRALGLYESINLDGGGSSTLWTSEEGVINHPYDNKVFDHEGERIVPNVIIVK